MAKRSRRKGHIGACGALPMWFVFVGKKELIAFASGCRWRTAAHKRPARNDGRPDAYRRGRARFGSMSAQ
ncbi:hypothetical protein C0Z19_13125 [Trinickia soli]|uniref:Uncharacterized protein n=1 Tax=Trinickia soli TaxID=380675 RepID=A0A2N7W5R3_9BURK|nr:hypothetical protein CIW54_04580 [Paraburkholderia sp. T12-10]PMS24741.1 hypothetical protein C0Z19_13125 [Trinickia soli]